MEVLAGADGVSGTYLLCRGQWVNGDHTQRQGHVFIGEMQPS